MSRVPLPALAVGYAGLVPFLYAVLLLLVAPGTLPTFGIVTSDPAGGMHVLEGFGAAILGFMGGCLWGFAAAPGRAPGWVLLAASAVPPALAFLALRAEPRLSCAWLAVGFAVLQAIDVGFQRAGVAPDWWLTLRLPLTAGVMACLLVGALHA